MKIIQSGDGGFSLANDGSLSVFFVGTGSAFTKTLYQNNFIIIKGETHILIDCGTRFSTGLAKSGGNVTDIKTIYITHSHADHVGGMEELLLMHRYVSKTKPLLVIPAPYRKKLWEESLCGGLAYNERAKGKLLTLEDYASVREPEVYKSLGRDAWKTELDDIELIFIRNCHIPNDEKNWRNCAWSTSVIVDRRIFFTSDLRFEPKFLYEIFTAFPIEYCFHDCQFFNGGVHASLEELSTLPPEYKEKIILSHYSDDWEYYIDQVQASGFHSFARQHVFYDFDK